MRKWNKVHKDIKDTLWERVSVQTNHIPIRRSHCGWKYQLQGKKCLLKFTFTEQNRTF